MSRKKTKKSIKKIVVAVVRRVPSAFDDDLFTEPGPVPTGQTSQTGLMLLHLRLRFFGLGFVDQRRNPVVFW
jgi:hypothetical protein